MIPTAAVILAGGRGRRLGGVVKANIEIGGVRLLERVSAALGALPDAIILAHGGIDPAAIEVLPGQVALADLPTGYAGPLAGVAAAVQYCRAGLAAPPAALVTIAVDTPFVPHDYVARMIAGLGADKAAVVRYDGQDYPTNAIWRLSAVADLAEQVAAGAAPHSLKRLAAAVGAVPIDWPAEPAGDPFANINTPADLAALEARAAQ